MDRKEEVSITQLAVICQLSDGSYRTILTDRKTECGILQAIINNESDGVIRVSDKQIYGVTLEIPDGSPTLDEYIKSTNNV